MAGCMSAAIAWIDFLHTSGNEPCSLTIPPCCPPIPKAHVLHALRERRAVYIFQRLPDSSPFRNVYRTACQPPPAFNRFMVKFRRNTWDRSRGIEPGLSYRSGGYRIDRVVIVSIGGVLVSIAGDRGWERTGPKAQESSGANHLLMTVHLGLSSHSVYISTPNREIRELSRSFAWIGIDRVKMPRRLDPKLIKKSLQ
jgi:hypothetical protein